MAAANKNGSRPIPVRVNFSDSLDLSHEQVDWSPRGVSLLTKWYFAEGTEVEFAFDHGGRRHCCSGVVVGCQELRHLPGRYVTVLFFVETPCPELRHAACDCRLAHEQHRPEREVHFTHRPSHGRLF